MHQLPCLEKTTSSLSWKATFWLCPRVSSFHKDLSMEFRAHIVNPGQVHLSILRVMIPLKTTFPNQVTITGSRWMDLWGHCSVPSPRHHIRALWSYLPGNCLLFFCYFSGYGHAEGRVGWQHIVSKVGSHCDVDGIGCHCAVGEMDCHHAVDRVGCHHDVDMVGCHHAVGRVGCHWTMGRVS